MSSKKLLTFELSADGDSLDIHMDRDGLTDLREDFDPSFSAEK